MSFEKRDFVEPIEEEAFEISKCQICNSRDLLDAFKFLPEYRQKKCANCGFIFVSPRPTIESISRYYSHPTQYDGWIDDENPRDVMWKRRVKQLCDLNVIGPRSQKSPRSILDVGAGIGQFLVHLKPFFEKLFGTEVSESAIAIGKSKYNLEIFQGVIETIDFDHSGGFDVVSLVHALEHVYDPRTTIMKCKKILNKDGLLLIYIPNEIQGLRFIVSRFLQRLFAVFGLRFRPNFTSPIDFSVLNREIHLSYFTPSTASKLLQDCGFEIVNIAPDPYFPVKRDFISLVKNVDFGIRSLVCKMSNLMIYDAFLIVAKKTNS